MKAIAVAVLAASIIAGIINLLTATLPRCAVLTIGDQRELLCLPDTVLPGRLL